LAEREEKGHAHTRFVVISTFGMTFGGCSEMPVQDSVVAQTIAVAGYSEGLPLKIALNQHVRVNDTTSPLFYGTFDVQPGNSGSPVVNQTTGEVEGVLVTSPGSYMAVSDGNGGTCSRTPMCSDDSDPTGPLCAWSTTRTSTNWSGVQRAVSPARFVPPFPAHCSDGTWQPATESSLNCGKECGFCAQGLNCSNNEDCESLNCMLGRCGPPPCQDGIQDYYETDVDCGRSCTTLCPVGKKCNYHQDCTSFHCVSVDGGTNFPLNGVCQP
jgi:hypothetical protein